MQPFSKKITTKIERPRAIGYFTHPNAEERGMRCVIGRNGALTEGSLIALYLLVDPEDGVIVDAKYQVFGDPQLIASAEALTELIQSKNYDQAQRLTPELIDKHLRDFPDIPVFTERDLHYAESVLAALRQATSHCLDLPLPTAYVSPLPPSSEERNGDPRWHTFNHEERLALIEKVLDEEIRPYIELDAGGITLVELTSDNELKISYHGSCTSCMSSIGSTLSAIQDILQTKVHPALTVIPNMDDLKFAPE